MPYTDLDAILWTLTSWNVSLLPHKVILFRFTWPFYHILYEVLLYIYIYLEYMFDIDVATLCQQHSQDSIVQAKGDV